MLLGGRGIHSRNERRLEAEHLHESLLEQLPHALARCRLLLQRVDIFLAREREHEHVVLTKFERLGREDDHPGVQSSIFDDVEDLGPGIPDLRERDRADRN